MTTAEVLREARRLIEVHGWVQGYAGSPREGFCMLAALRHNVDTDQEYVYMLDALKLGAFHGLFGPGRPSLTLWNDAPGHTVLEVLEKFDEAIARAES